MLNKQLLIDREPNMHKFKKEMIESYFVRETEIYNQFIQENDVHMGFVRKMIENEFSKNNEESQSFYQKYTIKSFDQVRSKIKSSLQNKKMNDLESIRDKEFLESNNIGHLKLSKPNMFEIVRSRALNMRNEEIKHLINSSFDVFAIMRTIRGIMDSYWMMMQLYNDPKQYCTFCEFAYIWIGSFEVDKITCKIVENVSSSRLV